ncbi:EAL domain-containing protein, partial [Escherichia coli]
GKNSLNRLIRCVCGKKIGPDPRNFNQRVSLGRNDLLIRTFPNTTTEKWYIWISTIFVDFYFKLRGGSERIYISPYHHLFF